MAIKKVWIENGCIACGLCQEMCPQLFEVDETAIVKENINLVPLEKSIVTTAKGCPVEVIKYE